jgi:hypothetical protein
MTFVLQIDFHNKYVCFQTKVFLQDTEAFNE